MNAIIGYADLASRHIDDAERLKKYMKNIYIPKRAFCKKSSFLDGFYYIMVKLGEDDRYGRI